MTDRMRDWGLLCLVVATLFIASALQHKTAMWFIHASTPPLIKSAEAETTRAAANPTPELPPLPEGRGFVSTLPEGCAPLMISGVAYERCGGTFYRPYLNGSTRVYCAEPP
ncbi:MAG: hypothetical protein ACJ790_21510 [Myxococcaceae bacterium]